MKNKIYVAGMGPGFPTSVTEAALEVCRNASCLIVAKRHEILFPEHKNKILLGELSELREIIKKELEKGNVAVAVSGDPGIYSLMAYIKRTMTGEEIIALPGISSLQSIFATAQESWNDACILSGHGKKITSEKLLGSVRKNRKCAFFCGTDKNPSWVCETIKNSSLSGIKVYIGENLSYPEERISVGSPEELAGGEYDSLSIMVIINENFVPHRSSRPKDDEFIRTEVPMTREEVRSVVTDKLEIGPESCIWDLGAGTGSVTVACALQADEGSVYAVEKKHEAVELIKKNIEKFRLCNVTVYEGNALEKLGELPLPTHVFIGGSGSELEAVLRYIAELGNGIKVVVTGVTLKTNAVAYEVLTGSKYRNFDAVQLSVSKARKLGSSHIMTAQNPITIMSAETVKENL